MKKILLGLASVVLLGCTPPFADDTVNIIGVNPPDLTGSLDGSILTVANGALGDANTSFSHFKLLQAGFNAFSLQYIIQNTTLTVEFSNDLGDVTDGDATWTDGTLTATDGVAATITSNGSLTVSTPLPWSRVRIRRLTTNATNALQLRLTRMRLN